MRRRQLGLVGLGVLAGCQGWRVAAVDLDVVVVGAGLAGLTVAYGLAQRGVRVRVLEGSDRLGGRVWTQAQGGQPVELGGEFIDEDHRQVRQLVRALGLSLVPVQTQGRMGFFLGGQQYTAAQVTEQVRPIWQRVRRDYQRLPEREQDFPQDALTRQLDRASITDYLDRLGVRGWVRRYLEIQCQTEFGLDVGEQSALNLIFWLAEAGAEPEQEAPRYRIAGGNRHLVERLAAKLTGQIALNWQVEAVQAVGQGYRLSGGGKELRAQAVVLAVPLTRLRQMELGIGLSPAQQRAVQTWGYGTNGKVVMQTERAFWRTQGYSGETITDGGYQYSWAHGEQGLTFFLGGQAGLNLPTGQAGLAVMQKYMGSTAPITAETQVAWGREPWALGSYTCFQPGQWTTLAGALTQPVGRVWFAGEHTGGEWQGYMEGAVRSGQRVAQALGRG